GEVLDLGRLPSRFDHRVEVGIARTTGDGVELLTSDGERGADLDEGTHEPRPHADRSVLEALLGPEAAGGDRRVLPAARAGEVDQLPGGQVVREAPSGLVVDLRP